MQKLYEKYMYFIGLTGQLLFYLQAYEIFSSKKADNVSFLAFLFGLLSVSSWLIYGFMLNNRVLIISNAFAVVGALAVVIGILSFSS